MQQQHRVSQDPLELFREELKVGGYPRLKRLLSDKNGIIIKFLANSLDINKICLEENICPVCGQFLQPGEYYFILTKQDVERGYSTEPPMHIECAYYRLSIFPHWENHQRTYSPNKVYLIGAGEYQLQRGESFLFPHFKKLLMKLIYKYDERQKKLILI